MLLECETSDKTCILYIVIWIYFMYCWCWYICMDDIWWHLSGTVCFTSPTLKHFINNINYNLCFSNLYMYIWLGYCRWISVYGSKYNRKVCIPHNVSHIYTNKKNCIVKPKSQFLLVSLFDILTQKILVTSSNRNGDKRLNSIKTNRKCFCLIY